MKWAVAQVLQGKLARICWPFLNQPSIWEFREINSEISHVPDLWHRLWVRHSSKVKGYYSIISLMFSVSYPVIPLNFLERKASDWDGDWQGRRLPLNLGFIERGLQRTSCIWRFKHWLSHAPLRKILSLLCIPFLLTWYQFMYTLIKFHRHATCPSPLWSHIPV